MANKIVELENRGSVTLSPTNHLATGGEASVYKQGDTIIKVYLDPDKMVRDGMVDKVALLRPLKTKSIVAPEGIVFDKKTKVPVGFYMGFVQGEPLPRVFTTSYWQKESFDADSASTLVDGMLRVVESAHSHKATLVDANELNWLASRNPKPTPHVIDVDSWAIGKWPAKVIMPSIRDWHSKSFNEQTDWFSWGVVTFQIYTGIHPYRGTLDGYKPNEWEKRMKDNASVFSKGVRLNAAVRDFNKIPSALRGWYEATFQNGDRTIPPSPFAASISVAATAMVYHQVTTVTGNLVFEKIFDVYPVLRTWPCSAVLVRAKGQTQVWDAKTKKKLFDVPPYSTYCEVIRVSDGWVMAVLEGNAPRFYYCGDDLTTSVFDLKLSGRALFRSENRLFLATDDSLLELGYMKLSKPILSITKTISVLHPQAIQWFDGVGIEKAFTSTFIITTVGDEGTATTRVPELDGLDVISAKAGKRFASFVCEDKKGDLQKIELTFSDDYTTYKVWRNGTDSHDLNMSILQKGVCATIVKDGELVIFVPVNGNIKRVQDKKLSTGMTLGNFGDTVVYVDNGVVWSLKMK